ncbi:MAG TPA: hypothetical protein PKD92_11370 [Novosphingobium sp.]|nr:hypothetical protein [Novosphingobium sp.]
MQERLFLPPFGYAPLLHQQEVWEAIGAPHALAFDPGQARDLIAARRAAAGEGLVPVISAETLCGMPFRGARESLDYARRISQLSSDARILITIRAQVPIIVATYMQYVRRGGTRSPERFFTHRPTRGYDRFDIGHFQYDRLVRTYQDLFGPDRVRVMTQEQLIADPVRFISDLAAFAGVQDRTALPDTSRVGVSDPEAANGLLRLINHFRFDDATDWPLIDTGRLGTFAFRATSALFRRQPLRSLTGRNRPVTALARRLYGGTFAESNRRLLDLCAPWLGLPGYDQ